MTRSKALERPLPDSQNDYDDRNPKPTAKPTSPRPSGGPILVSRSRLAIWNYSSALLFTCVTFLGLFVTKYLQERLGPERFGAMGMVVNWIGFFSVFEIGLSATLAPLMSRAIAREDRNELEGILAAGSRAYLALVCLAIMLGLALVPLILWLVPVSLWVKPDLICAWCIGVVGLAPMILSPFRALTDARQRGFVTNLALSGQSMLIFGLSMLFAFLGLGVTGQLAATAIAALPLALVLTSQGVKAFPGIFLAMLRARPSPQVWQSISSLATATILMALCGRISLLTDNLVVGKILDPAIAGFLIISVKLTTLAQSQLQNIGQACWAGLAELHTQERRADFNNRLIELTGLVTLLGLAALAPIVAWSRYFVSFWIGPEKYLGDSLVAVSAVNALLLGVFGLWFWCFGGTGRARQMLPVTVASATVNVAFSILLTYLLGPIGPSLGTTASFVLVSVWYLPYALRRDFGTPIVPLFTAMLRPLAVGLPYAMLLYQLSRWYPPRGWFDLAFSMGISALLFLVLSFQFILSPTDRAAWAFRFRQAIGFRGQA
jgi:O-antigen/teichoic acid export membrane protein